MSQSTASRVINGSARSVSDDLARRVMAAAAELHYAANVQAQAVAKGTTSTVALLVSDIASDYFSSMAAALMVSAEQVGLRVTVAVTERRVGREIELVRELRGQRARAIVLAESGSLSADGTERLVEELQTYERAGGKVVVVSSTSLPFDSLDLDNVGGARRLAIALARLGYRSFHVLGGEEHLVATRDRIDGLRAGLAERGIELTASDVTFSPFSWEGASAAIATLDDEVLTNTQVIFAVNDEMALGAIAGLRHRGIRVPEDIAVAGFDDIRTLRNVVPSLTTVHVPVGDIGGEVISLITGEKQSPAVLQSTVVLRDTTPRLA